MELKRYLSDKQRDKVNSAVSYAADVKKVADKAAESRGTKARKLLYDLVVTSALLNDCDGCDGLRCVDCKRQLIGPLYVIDPHFVDYLLNDVSDTWRPVLLDTVKHFQKRYVRK